MVSKMEGQFFLSRPRRFGKSLTLSTLESVFKGEKKLFKGLYIYDQTYDWKPYPIIRLAMNVCSSSNEEELGRKLCYAFDDIGMDHGVSLVREGASSRFEELIGKLRRLKGSQVVILIDEYDKPILDNILARDEVLKIRTLLRTARSTFFALRVILVERAVPGTLCSCVGHGLIMLDVAHALLQSVAFYTHENRWSCYLFLLMPDHLHGLFSIPQQTPMGKLIGGWKRYHTKTSEVIWQDNFFDHRIRTAEEFTEKYQYIEQNHVAKGLCTHAADWPWKITCTNGMPNF